MEHTLRAYLQRLPVEKLQEFLRQYEAGELKEDFTYIMPYVRLELFHRQDRENKPKD